MLKVCWEDKNSGFLKNFHLYFYPTDGSVEMFDLRLKKTFLKKTENSSMKLGDLYIGNTIVLYSRTLQILDYGDDFTRNNCSTSSESTFVMVKPGGVQQIGNILSNIQNSGFTLARAKMIQMGRHQAEQFCRKYQISPSFNELVVSLSSGGLCLVMELVSKNAVSKWRDLMDARSQQQNEVDTDHDILYGSLNVEEAKDEINYFFPKSRLKSPTRFPIISHYNSETANTTCCIIRPHAFRIAGDILQNINNAGFFITAMETFHLDFSKSDEFLEVYKGVIENYGEVVKELSSGPCLVLQIVGNSDDPVNIVQTFRQFCGPMDPKTAKSLRPNTLRAKYGEDITKNAVHCTDLVEDGPLEVEYFFKVLQ